MYAHISPQFNSGMLTRYLTTQLTQIGRASSLVILLISKINWKEGANQFGPCGTINHLTVRKMANALGCSPSTIHEHLAVLRESGIIGSEPVTDKKGATQYCRIWFAGFVKWLQMLEQEPVNNRQSAQSPEKPDGRGSEKPDGRGSEKPDTYHKTKNQNFIDLNITKNISFSPLEQIIREEQRKSANGEMTDCQIIYDRFRELNLSKGTSKISLNALRGFSKSFLSFPSKTAAESKKHLIRNHSSQKNTAITPTPPIECGIKKTLKAQAPELFETWFKQLTFIRDGHRLNVKAPTNFIRTYVSNNYEQIILKAAGPLVKIVYS